MTERDTEATLRAALLTRAENAMAVTDTDRELDKLHARLRPAARLRRMRMIGAAAAAVAVAGAGAGLAVTLADDGSGGSDRSPTSSAPPSPVPTGHRLPAGTIPAGFPVGSFQHPGTYGLATLVLRRNGTAAEQDQPDDIAFELKLTFTEPDLVTFTTTRPNSATISAACSAQDGVYHWAVAHGQLMFTVVSDPCANRRIPLTEVAWPISGG